MVTSVFLYSEQATSPCWYLYAYAVVIGFEVFYAQAGELFPHTRVHTLAHQFVCFF